MSFCSTNPYTGEENASFEALSPEALEQIIAQAHEAWLSRKATPATQKKQLFLKMADVLEANLEHHAKLQTIEMGMLYSASVKGLQSTVDLIRWFANNFERLLAEEEIAEEGLTGHIQYDSIGVIYGIAPWNFPYNQLLRAAVPNIIAGNTQIYKHASNVPLCAQAIESLFHDAGFPKGIYTNIFSKASQSEAILANPLIKGVNLTGGEYAGKAIGSLAGKYLKPAVLELGGNDAFVLLDHADTEAMAAEAVKCRIANAGQKCNSSKRFIVLDKHYDAFVEAMAAHMESLQVGDPMDPSTQLGPLATSALLKEIDQQVQATVQEGARLVTGGKILDADRQLYAPTLLAEVTPEMTSYQQEVFGPVASVIKSSSIEASIAIANANDFGLSAVVYGDDLGQCKAVASQLEGGMIFVNKPAGSKACLPFGGVKKSGYGKENGVDGLRAFTNKKVVLY